MADKIDIQGTEYYVSCGLSLEVRRAIKASRLSRQQTAHRIGISKEEIVRLLDGSPFHLSVTQLTSYLHCLGYDVELSASVRKRTPKAKEQVQKKREAMAA